MTNTQEKVIVRLYIKERYSARRISRRLRVHHEVVRNILKKHSIKLRSRSEEARTGTIGVSGEYWSSCKFHARRRDIPFNLSIVCAQKRLDTQKGCCALSGIPLIFGYETDRTASLDRINSAIGYSASNIQWVHKKINAMKSKMSDLDFIEWCKLVAAHN